MKKLFLALSILISANLFANSVPSFIKDVNAKTITLGLQFWKLSQVTITIKDENGITMFGETLQKPTANRQYNLSKMNDGDYIITIENKQKIAAQKLSIKKGEIFVAPTIEETFKPIFITNSTDVWAIQALSLSENADVKIIDENNNIIYTEKISKPVVEKKYNVSKLPVGSYEIVYAVNDHVFTQTAYKK